MWKAESYFELGAQFKEDFGNDAGCGMLDAKKRMIGGAVGTACWWQQSFGAIRAVGAKCDD
jgi:hypothetical protein